MYKVKIINNGKIINYENNMTLEEIAKDNNILAYGAKVNNRLHDLNYYIDSDVEIEFVDLEDSEGARIYQNTLRYLICMVIKRLYPKYRVRFAAYISRSFLCTVSGIKEDKEFVDLLTNEIKKLVEKKLKIERLKLSKEEAYNIYQSEGYLDKLDTLKYRPENYVNIYKCEDYYNYMYGYMLPSTEYIKDFNLIPYEPGFIVQYPRSEAEGVIPDFEDDPSLSKMIKEAYQWRRMCKINTLADMNAFTDTKEFVDFVNMCETKHNNMLAELGEKIKSRINTIKLIAIAGPSSSGKTTFCNRLRVELMSRGIFPLMISLDDYYKNREDTPKDENGKPDFEHIEALDLELLNQQLNDLIEGKEVIIPKYNFKTGLREEGLKVKLEQGQPILIEGIHGLNERLTSSLPRNVKFKVYISPFPQINNDDHNPIMATDIRKLRRCVRDAKFRHTSPAKTFEMWPSVRKGEFKWIYPFQKDADYVYNTELTYEIMVMKKYALPALKEIKRDSEYYIEANRLIKFLKIVRDIDDKYVPCNSILREFIGDSCFYDYDE